MKNWIRKNKKLVIILSIILTVLLLGLVSFLVFFRSSDNSINSISSVLIRETKNALEDTEEVDEEEEELDNDQTADETYPDMVRESWTENLVRDFASRNGLEIAVDRRNVSSQNQDGVVISQTPAPGTSVVRGARITVTIGRYVPATTQVTTTPAPTTTVPAP